MLHIIYCYRSAIPDLLQHLQSRPIPSLHYLRVWCRIYPEARALTKFLPLCTNLCTLQYERGENNVLEIVEEKMWVAAVKRCRNLEVVIIRGDNSAVSCKRLLSVLRKLSERKGLHALKLKKIVALDRDGREQHYTEHVKHLLPALQQ